MPKVKTSWQARKAEGKKPQYASIKLVTEKPDGLNDLAQWLETSKPEKALEDLRNYQLDWCPHVDSLLASKIEGEKRVSLYCCSECGKVTRVSGHS